jgi:DNA mismatch repair protein MutS2
VQEKIYQLLEFDKIKIQLANCVTTTLGRVWVERCSPSTDLTEVEQRLQATDQAFAFDRLTGGLSFAGVSDTMAAMKRAMIGSILAASELIAVATNIEAARRVRRLIRQFHEDNSQSVPILFHLVSIIGDHKSIAVSIRACIDEQGHVLDQASTELTKIRQEIRAAESKVREKLEQMMRSSTMQKMLQEILVTIRNERYVLPVKAEYRSAVHGIIHDQSASGATLYIEPEVVVQLNNRLKELKLREEREIEVILSRLSDQVAAVAGNLLNELDVLGQLDFMFAKSKLARLHKASLPMMNAEGKLRIRKARHPLLDVARVVPLDLQLGFDYRGIIVTGPNTGGKTVALKTLGLLSLMAMSGLFVPLEDGSELSIFDGIYADIGDEQSIEQNLSTFSGHMKNMIRILESVTVNSLVLLDEMGAGTDPTEGAALAIAILEHLRNRGCTFVSTTHYSSLKAYAEECKDIVNASVEFDTESLQPTYRLLVGIPGRSNALAIAERLGLPTHILQMARKQLTEDDLRVERLLLSLEEQRLELERRTQELSVSQQETERMRSEVAVELKTFQSEKQKKLDRAREEAKQVSARARAEAEQLLAEIRDLHERQRQQSSNIPIKEHELIEARRKLKQMQDNLHDSSNDTGQVEGNQTSSLSLSVGDEVRVVTLGQKGTIVELVNDKEIVVQIGSMRTRVKNKTVQKLRDVSQISQRDQVHQRTSGANVQRPEMRTTKLELDVRGQSLDDAIMEVDQYLSDVVLAGFAQVMIIHGVGTGVLRKGVQDYLRSHRHVKSYRAGRYGEGDLGVTVVEMK